MIQWILIIHVFATSINGTDSYNSIRFNSHKACQAYADKINRVDEQEIYKKHHKLMEVTEEAECVKDSDKNE